MLCCCLCHYCYYYYCHYCHLVWKMMIQSQTCFVVLLLVEMDFPATWIFKIQTADLLLYMLFYTLYVQHMCLTIHSSHCRQHENNLLSNCLNTRIWKYNERLMLFHTCNCFQLEREMGACLILSARENSTGVTKCNDFYHAGMLIWLSLSSISAYTNKFER